MIFHDCLVDKKIRALNVAVSFSLEEYHALAVHILEKNEFQRNKVSAVGKVYQLLKQDLISGCVMLPIIIAIDSMAGTSPDAIVINSLNEGEVSKNDREKLYTIIASQINEKNCIILDGLQRTYTVLEAFKETKGAIGKGTLRAEIYFGLNKAGILYRMLTLNTGQSPMTLRHQIEILYSDLLDSKNFPEGIKVFKQIDTEKASNLGEYKYSDVVDMFYSYTTGMARSLDRPALVEKLKETTFLEEYDAQKDNDVSSLLQIYNNFVTHLDHLCAGWEFIGTREKDNWESLPKEYQIPRPFGSRISKVFGRVQAMTAFSAEVNRLRKAGQIENPLQMNELIGKCAFGSGDKFTTMDNLIVGLHEETKAAKRYGDAQRLFFQLCFRELLNKSSNSYLDLSSCWAEGQLRYHSLYGDPDADADVA
jgi:hypothetical protein